VSAPRTQLEVRANDGDGVATVVVEGELDIATVPVLEGALSDLESGGARTLVLDLRGLRFMDSTGLRALLSARRRAHTAGRRLRLANLQPSVARVFEVTGVARLFDTAATT
jgi:anti-anti-sigma factor